MLSLIVMSLAGLLVGWRIRTSLLDAIGGFLLLFAYAFSWVMALVGLLVPSPEVVNNASFAVIFPLTFIANTFVPPENLPTVLRVMAEWNPISALTQAARELFGNLPEAPPGQVLPLPLEHPVAASLAWAAPILAIFVPLSVRQYQRAASQ